MKELEEDSKSKINKLPKWAQEFISDLLLQRDRAIKLIHDFQDGQTPAPFYHEESSWEGAGAHVVVPHYIQARSVTCCHAGMEVQMCVHENGKIKLYLNTTDRAAGDVAIYPEASNVIVLVKGERNGRKA